VARVAERGIRVTVAPGPIVTPIFDRAGLPKEAMDDFAKQLIAKGPMKRFGQPEDVAATVDERLGMSLISEDRRNTRVESCVRTRGRPAEFSAVKRTGGRKYRGLLRDRRVVRRPKRTNTYTTGRGQCACATSVAPLALGPTLPQGEAEWFAPVS
jgi:hypothetical protein